MKVIQDKIAKEIKESVNLRSLTIGMPYEQAMPVREEQNKKYKKIQFLKGLNEALKKKITNNERG